MILTADTLRHALSGGHTLTRGHPFEGAGSPIWFIAETCEQVHTFAVRALTHAGELAAVQRDLAGDPLQFGLSSNTAPPPLDFRGARWGLISPSRGPEGAGGLSPAGA
jgi:hypothetical protein